MALSLASFKMLSACVLTTRADRRLLQDSSPRFGRVAMPINARRQPSKFSVSASASSANGDVAGEMLEPSAANNPVVRFAALAATVALAARSTAFLPSAALGFVHTLAFSTWFGTLAWTSFVFGIVAFRNLPRQTFGRLQSKLFPKYFALSSAAPGILLGTLYYATSGAAPVKEFYLLGIALMGSLVNLLFTEPAATKVMFQRYELENSTGPRDEKAIKALSKQFGKWHGISSLLNLIVLICAVGHAYYIGSHINF